MKITSELAAFASRSRFATLPDHVRTQAARAFLNWMGCVLGGSHEPAVEIARASVAEAGGHRQASIIGHGQRTDVASAAFLNCLSSSVLAFDDTHLATVTHPTGPVAAALLASCEQATVSGEDFLNALALGIEIECRMSNVLLLPPAQSNVGLYVTGLTGPIGAAAAMGNLFRFDEKTMIWALGLAATQASGFRATHGSMAGLVVPALAARNGVSAAILASKGFTCSDDALESENGFIGVFSLGADLGHAVNGLGERFELLQNAYKPYPCGIVIHPTIDACLDIAGRLPPDAKIENVECTVHPLALTLTGRRSPASSLEAQISLYHWAAAGLLRRSAGVAELRPACIADPAIVALRNRIEAIADPALGRDEAIMAVTLADSSVLQSQVTNARGSINRPMTDDELDAKFIRQASGILSASASGQLLHLCRNLASLRNVGREIGAVINI
jgi:2-methylcitrate dehydratase PrpD